MRPDLDALATNCDTLLRAAEELMAQTQPVHGYIATLEAENAKLREALREFVDGEWERPNPARDEWQRPGYNPEPGDFLRECRELVGLEPLPEGEQS